MKAQRMTKFKYTEDSLSVRRHPKKQVPFLISSLLCIAIFSGILDKVATNEAVSSGEISVLAVGDITVSSRMTPLIERKGAGVFFEGTAALIQSADVATASLNTSISERGEPRYGIENPFRAVPGLGRAIANAGFNAVSLATPHVMDFGLEALEGYNHRIGVV